MTQLTKFAGFDLDPFDLLWRNFIDHDSRFNTLLEKVNYPTDIYETEEGITFELAVVGLDSKDISVETQGEVLRIKYTKEKHEDEAKYIYKGIAKRSFDLAWKVSSKFDLTKLEAQLERGLLTIRVPFAETAKAKAIQIKEVKQIG
jgi:HSP20 family molecular chaperone IbpA